MKPLNHLVFPCSLALLCLGWIGCASQRIASPLGSGYEQVAHPTRASIDQPESTRISLEYRKADGTPIVVWPSLYGVNEVVKGDLVIFVGDQAYVHPDSDDPKGLKPRLFAARTPGLPLDITDEILWQWSKSAGKDFAHAAQLFSLASPEEKNGRLELTLAFANDDKDWPDAVMELDWTQVSDIMREVKAKGTVRKDLRWGTRYIAK